MTGRRGRRGGTRWLVYHNAGRNLVINERDEMSGYCNRRMQLLNTVLDTRFGILENRRRSVACCAGKASIDIGEMRCNDFKKGVHIIVDTPMRNV